MQVIGEANSNVEAMKKEVIDQAKSYNGIIDEKDNAIAKVHMFVCTYRYICICKGALLLYVHMYVAVF